MNKFKSYILLAGGVAALAVIAAGITAGPAIAQIVKAALVQNVDEPGRNPYSEDFTIGPTVFPCTSNVCDIKSNNLVPAGKRLVITNIIGHVVTVNGTAANTELLTIVPPATGVGQVDLPHTIAFAVNNLYTLDLNLQMLSYFEAGQSLELFVSTNGTFAGGNTSIRISGYFVKL